MCIGLQVCHNPLTQQVMNGFYYEGMGKPICQQKRTSWSAAHFKLVNNKSPYIRYTFVSTQEILTNTQPFMGLYIIWDFKFRKTYKLIFNQTSFVTDKRKKKKTLIFKYLSRLQMDGDELIKVMKYLLCLKGVRWGCLCKLFMGHLISNV